MGNTRWTEESVRELMDHHADGLSHKDIAEIMGREKGAITGKLKRLGLSSRGNRRGPYDDYDSELRSPYFVMASLRRQNESALASLWEHHSYIMTGRNAA